MIVYSYRSRKSQIRLRFTVARSGDIVLPGVYLLSHYVRPNDVDNDVDDEAKQQRDLNCPVTHVQLRWEVCGGAKIRIARA